MPQLPFDYDGTPDEHEPIPPIVPGNYNFQVVEADIAAAASGKGNNLKLVLKLTEDQGEESGKQVWDYIPTWVEFAQVRVKRFLKSVNHTPDAAGLDTEDLVGLFGKASIKNTPYKDDEGETVLGNKVKDYLFEGETQD